MSENLLFDGALAGEGNAGTTNEDEGDQLVQDAVNAAVRAGAVAVDEAENENEHEDDGDVEVDGADDEVVVEDGEEEYMAGDDDQPAEEEEEALVYGDEEDGHALAEEGVGLFDEAGTSTTTTAAALAKGEACQSVYYHREYNALLAKYQDALAHHYEQQRQIDELRTRLTRYEHVEPLPQPPTFPPAPAPIMPVAIDENTDPSLSHSTSHQPAQSSSSRKQAKGKDQAPPLTHEEKMARYREEVLGWVRPVLTADQVARVPNYFSSHAVYTNMQAAFVDLDGNKPPNDEWNKWQIDRRVVCLDILDPVKTWGDQDPELVALACDVIEKRHPQLSYCDDTRWKARNFLKKRVDQMGKVTGSGAGKNYRRKEVRPKDESASSSSLTATTASAAGSKQKKNKKRADSAAAAAAAAASDAGSGDQNADVPVDAPADLPTGLDATTGARGDNNDDDDSTATVQPPKPKRQRKAPPKPKMTKKQKEAAAAAAAAENAAEDQEADDARTEAIIRGTTDLLVSGGVPYDLLSSALSAASGSTGQIADSRSLNHAIDPSLSNLAGNGSTAGPSRPNTNVNATDEATTAAAIAAALNSTGNSNSSGNAYMVDPLSGSFDPHFLAQMLQREGILPPSSTSGTSAGIMPQSHPDALSSAPSSSASSTRAAPPSLSMSMMSLQPSSAAVPVQGVPSNASHPVQAIVGGGQEEQDDDDQAMFGQEEPADGNYLGAEDEARVDEFDMRQQDDDDDHRPTVDGQEQATDEVMDFATGEQQ